MKIIRRNTPEFRKLRDQLNELTDDPKRHEKVQLYSLKPSEELSKKVLLSHRSAAGKVIYDLAFETLLFNIIDAGHKLFYDEEEKVYYFKTSGSSKFIDLPFRISGLKKHK
jgi:hypothetical protein